MDFLECWVAPGPNYDVTAQCFDNDKRNTPDEDD